MRPILLAGPAGSGKDQAAQFLAIQWHLTVHHLAEPLYALADTPAWQHATQLLTAEDDLRETLARWHAAYLADRGLV